ncbi:FAD/NAD(P)-binding domain-containing protein [Astrocystis sublimbata]|nr:FAD/NAD(P)-binding domain-containing protein [Astrocystis sublimbata]
MPSRKPPFTAAVCGAGIAGLAAAIALRRAGFQVTVYERSGFKNEIGAAITVPPNATCVLQQWGFDFAAARPVPNLCTRYVAADTLETLSESRYENIEAEMGSACLSFHRVDLHNGLKALATEDSEGFGEPNEFGRRRWNEDFKGFPVDIFLGCRVSSVDCDLGVLTLANGTVIQADLVIIADGAHSELLTNFLGYPCPSEPTGRSVYRWLVPANPHNSAGQLCAGRGIDGFVGWSDPRKNVFWVAYTCSGGTVLSNAVVHDTVDANGNGNGARRGRAGDGKSNAADGETSWRTPATKAAVYATCSNFNPSILRLVSMASDDDIQVHQLFQRPPLESFVRGRTAIIGDAAHVMMPTHAAGAAMSIESAGVLEVLFENVQGNGNSFANWTSRHRQQIIKERLALFDKLRIPRCNLAMILSNAGPEGLRRPGVEEDIRKFYHGPLPSRNALPWSAEFRGLLFNYNVFIAGTQALGAEMERKRLARDVNLREMGRMDLC